MTKTKKRIFVSALASLLLVLTVFLGFGTLTASAATTTTAACAYSVGQRVSHPKFGNGKIVTIEALATDHKLVVEFDAFGSKTLLTKLAKLTVL
jgi:DNA helicase-2/ATP-dependent DNA helicase PcrA